MYLNIYAIYDQASKSYLQPFLAPTDEMAARIISMTIRQDPQGALANFPDDHTLEHLGSFDNVLGHISQNEHGPRNIMGIKSLTKENPK